MKIHHSRTENSFAMRCMVALKSPSTEVLGVLWWWSSKWPPKWIHFFHQIQEWHQSRLGTTGTRAVAGSAFPTGRQSALMAFRSSPAGWATTQRLGHCNLEMKPIIPSPVVSNKQPFFTSFDPKLLTQWPNLVHLREKWSTCVSQNTLT